MFTAVEIADGGRGRRRRRGQPELVRVSVPEGTFFYVLRGSRRSDPQMLLRYAARCAPVVLTALPVPPDVGAQPFAPRAFPLLRAVAAMGVILPQTRLPPGKLSLGVLDPDGAMCGGTDALLPLAADVRIVTRIPQQFADDMLRARRRFGAGMTVGEEVALLKGCDAVVCASPDAAPVQTSVMLSCEPAHDAFSLLPVQMPERYARLCPDGVSPDLFAAALAEKCGVRATTFFACSGVVYRGTQLNTAQAAALWRARIERQDKNFS